MGYPKTVGPPPQVTSGQRVGLTWLSYHLDWLYGSISPCQRCLYDPWRLGLGPVCVSGATTPAGGVLRPSLGACYDPLGACYDTLGCVLRPSLGACYDPPWGVLRPPLGACYDPLWACYDPLGRATTPLGENTLHFCQLSTI